VETRVGRRSIAIVLFVAILIFAGYAGYQGSQYPKESLWLDLPDEPPRPLPDLENITLAEGFELPPNATMAVPVLEIVKPSITNETVRDVLDKYDLYMVYDETRVDERGDRLFIWNSDNLVEVDYENALFKYKNLEYNDTLYTDEEIQANISLLDLNEAFSIAIDFLKEHNLYNSSWELTWRFKRVMISGETGFTDYQYVLTPVIFRRPFCDPNVPSVSIIVSPKGEIVSLHVYLRDIRTTSKTALPGYSDPVLALNELDQKTWKYFSSMDPEDMVVLGMRQGYKYAGEQGPFTPGPVQEAIPCWTIYCGPDGRTVINI
jgi:hypothetical protein